MPPVTTPSKSDPKRSRPAQVAEAIKNWVVEQGMVPGDRLPSEPELIAHFGMAKGTIREAMRILEAQGLVKSRTGPGGGTFVHEVSRERAKALLSNYFYFKDLTIGDVYQVRRALEPELAATLAGHLNEAQLRSLEEIVAAYEQPPANVEEERDQHVASLAFHAKLAEFARNPLLSFVIGFTEKLLSDITVNRQLYAPHNLALWESGLDYHRRLIEALRAGESGAARAIMKAHMETAWAHMGDQEAKALRGFLPE